jgi:hypothetical protein
MTDTERKPWDQLEGESDESYARFLIYRSLGPARTLLLGYIAFRGNASNQKKPPHHAPKIWQENYWTFMEGSGGGVGCLGAGPCGARSGGDHIQIDQRNGEGLSDRDCDREHQAAKLCRIEGDGGYPWGLYLAGSHQLDP